MDQEGKEVNKGVGRKESHKGTRENGSQQGKSKERKS